MKPLLGVHLGCGGDLKTSNDETTWWNVDQSLPKWGVCSNTNVLESCITKVGSLFPRSSVDIVTSTFVFEHLTLTQLCDLLYQINSILKPTGVLEVHVPDMAALLQKFDSRVHRGMNAFDLWTEIGLRLFGDERQTFHKSVWTRHSAPVYLEMGGFFEARLKAEIDDEDCSLIWECHKKEVVE